VPALRVAIIAGEASGDILAAGLMQALKKIYPKIEFYGVGGDLMIAEGLVSKAPMEQLSVMGLWEVLGRLRVLLKLRKQLIADFIKNPPDLFIGVDAPDFNLNIELALKEAGILTVHYVSPSVWAWKKKRIFKIKKAVDLLLTLFPFEQQHYRETQQNIAFVGHTLAELIPQQYDTQSFKRKLALAENAKVIALLPGSRSSETKYLLGVFLATAQLFHQHYPQVLFVLPAANQYRYDEIKLQLEQYPDLPVTLLLQQSRDALSACDAVLIASGTATLEAALLGKPMVVAYKMAAVTYAIYSRMISAKYISLPNLLAGELLVPELLQSQVTVDNLFAELEKALFDEQRRDYQCRQFKKIHRQLDMAASDRAAAAIQKLLKQAPPDPNC